MGAAGSVAEVEDWEAEVQVAAVRGVVAARLETAAEAMAAAGSVAEVEDWEAAGSSRQAEPAVRGAEG